MERSALLRRWGVGLLLMLVLLMGVGCARGGTSSQPQQPPASAAPPTATAAPVQEEMPKAASPTPLPQMPTPTIPPSASPTVATGRIVGMVWEDRCPPEAATLFCREDATYGLIGDGARQPDEPALANIVVQLAQGSCPGTVLSVASTDAQGRFVFEGVQPGTYCVRIDPDDPANAMVRDGIWTYPVVGQSQVEVTVAPGAEVTVDFGVTRAPGVAEAEPTQAPPAGPQAAPTQDVAQANIPPTPTATPVPTNPYDLGAPDVLDTMDLPGLHWYLRWGTDVTFKTASSKPGVLVIQVHKPGPANYWTLSTYPPLRNAYIEATFITGPQCKHKDRYGLIVRAPSTREGYLFLVSCDARYRILRWNGGLKILKDWTPSDAIHKGPNRVNRVGVWMQDDIMKLYINRALVTEVQDDYFREGYFGVAAGSDRTPELEIYVDEVAYWILP
ncbi:MAG: hypothetical protein GXO54_02330 [Chloroflexi bacterium]|nr:hypothetical protein [Chloroflexota bacterium]